MKTYALWFLLVAPGVWMAETDAAEVRKLLPPDQVAQLIRQLDDDNYFVRERALDQLAEAGPQTLLALGDALVDGSPEVAWRASVAVEQIAINGDEKLLSRVADMLKKLSHKRPHLAKVANELAVRQQWARHETAVAQLRSLGGQLASADGESIEGGFMAVDVIDGLDIEMPEMEEDEDMAAAPEAGGIFGVIGAIARALVPGLGEAEPTVVPEPLEAELAPRVVLEALQRGGIEGEESADAGSPDVEIVDRARVRPVAADVEIIEADEPVMEAADEALDVEFGAVEFLGEIEASEEGGVSQISLDKRWLGGDDGLAHLKDVKGLASLMIEDARLTDASLKHVEAVPGLQQITLRGAKFTIEGLRKFRETKPNVRIWAYGNAMMGVGADMGATPLVLNHIYPKSGAQDAGLQKGDVIRRIDSLDISDFTDLMLSVYNRKVGDKLQVEFERSGKKMTAEVVLRAREVLERRAVGEEDPFK